MKKISEKIMGEIEGLYLRDKTVTLTDLAKQFSLSREGIKKRLVKRGVCIRSNNEIASNKRKHKTGNLCRIYYQVRSLRKVKEITGYSINFIKDCIKGKVDFPVYPRPLKQGFEKVSEEKVRIYAHTVFDGYISHSKYDSYTTGYVNKNPGLLEEFENDVEFVYGLKPTKSKLRNGVTCIIYSSKLMYYDILNFDKSIIGKNDNYKRVYLRAFFDDEGCVNFNPKRGKFFISGSQKKQEEILFIKSLLDDLKIKSNVYNSIVEITLNRDIIRYNELVGFTHPGKRMKLLNGLDYYKQKFEKIEDQNIRIKELSERGLNPYQISKIIDMPPSTIRHRVNSGFKANKYDYIAR